MVNSGHHAEAIAFAESPLWVKNYKFRKNTKYNSRSPLELFCAKQVRKKKHLIFEKWQHFQNGQNWPPCKGYSHCKIVTLNQKLKMSRTYKNNSRITLELFGAKNGSKKHLIFEKWYFRFFFGCEILVTSSLTSWNYNYPASLMGTQGK